MKRDAIKAELESIRKTHGGILRAEDVVDRATAKNNPLHDLFEWNDSAAAAEYRLWQARQIIRVTVGIIPGTEIKSRIFVSMMADRIEDDGGYRAMVDVLSDVERRALMLAEALDELNVFRRKYARLSELSKVFEAIEAIVPKPQKRKKQRA